MNQWNYFSGETGGPDAKACDEIRTLRISIAKLEELRILEQNWTIEICAYHAMWYPAHTICIIFRKRG